jgi:hypothetical protein
VIGHHRLFVPAVLRVSALALILGLAIASPLFAQQNPGKILGPDSCKDCHKQAAAVWDHTRHALSRDVLAKPEAQRIKTAKAIKTDADESEACTSCHGTPKLDGKKIKLVAGVSCESCHGAATEWIKVHSNFGSGKTAATEAPEHRDERLGASMAAGLLRPSNIYRVVQNCLQCHTAPDEEMVNAGGHSAGSAFEVVAWSQGMIRHNYGPDGQNREASVERRRQLYVVGQIAELEFALRRLATATADGTYSQALIKRAQEATSALKKIEAAAKVPELTAILKAAASAKLATDVAGRPALLAAAETISGAGQDFVDLGYAKELAGIDAMLPSPENYKGTPYRQ